jgi:uncharacterized OsmC-like protein
MSEHPTFRVEMERIEGYEYRVKFDWEKVPELVLDEPEPIGMRKGPNASRLLAAAVGNCLSASLLYCLEKSRAEIEGMRTVVTGTLVRNDRGRLRVGGLDVTIETKGVDPARLERCRALFEDFCTVSDSIREGIPIRVEVK